MTALYSEIEPYETGRLKVSDLHELHYELIGNPKGKPAVYLHGGPGSGANPFYRRYFNPEKYHLIMFDQRGCGKSTPHNELRENTTQLLVDDIEKLRKHLGIKNWLVYGGSWGSTLALAYAEEFPEFVTEMIMSGIYLGTREEALWLYQNGANTMFPDFWEEFVSIIDEKDRQDMLSAYHRKFTQAPKEEQLRAAKAWSLWEARALKLDLDPNLESEFTADEFAIAHARIECHYFTNDCFLKPNQLLDGVEKIKHIPAVIVNGRYDMICPPKHAWQVHKRWPKSKLVLPTAGHSGRDTNNQLALIEIVDSFADVFAKK
jgi:proline iminopeptidase